MSDLIRRWCWLALLPLCACQSGVTTLDWRQQAGLGGGDGDPYISQQGTLLLGFNGSDVRTFALAPSFAHPRVLDDGELVADGAAAAGFTGASVVATAHRWHGHRHAHRRGAQAGSRRPLALRARRLEPRRPVVASGLRRSAAGDPGAARRAAAAGHRAARLVDRRRLLRSRRQQGQLLLRHRRGRQVRLLGLSAGLGSAQPDRDRTRQHRDGQRCPSGVHAARPRRLLRRWHRQYARRHAHPCARRLRRPAASGALRRRLRVRGRLAGRHQPPVWLVPHSAVAVPQQTARFEGAIFNRALPAAMPLDDLVALHSYDCDDDHDGRSVELLQSDRRARGLPLRAAHPRPQPAAPLVEPDAQALANHDDGAEHDDRGRVAARAGRGRAAARGDGSRSALEPPRRRQLRHRRADQDGRAGEPLHRRARRRRRDRVRLSLLPSATVVDEKLESHEHIVRPELSLARAVQADEGGVVAALRVAPPLRRSP